MVERGFIKLPIIIAAALGLGFGASAYLNYAQHQRAEQDRRMLQGQITDLRYQLNQDQQTSPSPSPSTGGSPSPSPSPSSGPAVAGTASVSISQFGVKLTAIDPILDLTYAPIQSAGITVAGFTTQTLVAKYPACKPGVLGALVRRPKAQKAPSWNKPVKTLGDYSFYYSAAGSSDCTTDQAGHNTYAAAKAALSDGVMPSLSN